MSVSEVPLANLMAPRDGSVDPTRYPNETFCLYSIPSFDTGTPELLPGSSIGSAKQIVRPGDVLLSRIVPHIRRAWIVESQTKYRIIASGEWIVFRSSRADPRYLRHFLTSDSFHRQFMATVAGVGGSLLRARPSQVAEIRVPLPHLSEQRRIADILDKAHAIRRKRKEAIVLTEELLRSAFLEIFGDPVTNPKGWPRASVEDLCSHVVDCPHTTPTYESAVRLHPCVRTSDLQGGFFDWSTTKYVSEEEYRARIARLRPEPGDVFYTREGERYGIAAILPTNVEACLGQRMMLLRPNRAVATPEFLWASMNSVAVYRQATAEVGGSTSPHVNVKAIRRFSVLLPPINKQRDYSQLCEGAMRVRVAQLASYEQADTLFSALIISCSAEHNPLSTASATSSPRISAPPSAGGTARRRP